MFKNQAIKNLEEKIYNKIATEIQSGNIEQGTWAKGLAEANGDKEKAEARYIQLRFKKIKEKSIADYNKKKDDEYEKEAEKEQNEGNTTEKPPLYRRFLAGLISLIIIGLMSPTMSLITFIGVLLLKPDSASSFADIEAGGSIVGFLLSALLAAYAYRKISGYSKESLKSFKLTK